MIDYNEIKFTRQLVNGQVAKLIERSFIPSDRDAGACFLVALGCCDQRRKGATVVPSDASEQDRLAHAVSRTAADLRRPTFPSIEPLISRIFSQRFVSADSQAASMISIELRPSSPG